MKMCEKALCEHLGAAVLLKWISWAQTTWPPRSMRDFHREVLFAGWFKPFVFSEMILNPISGHILLCHVSSTYFSRTVLARRGGRRPELMWYLVSRRMDQKWLQSQ